MAKSEGNGPNMTKKMANGPKNGQTWRKGGQKMPPKKWAKVFKCGQKSAEMPNVDKHTQNGQKWQKHKASTCIALHHRQVLDGPRQCVQLFCHTTHHIPLPAPSLNRARLRWNGVRKNPDAQHLQIMLPIFWTQNLSWSAHYWPVLYHPYLQNGRKPSEVPYFLCLSGIDNADRVWGFVLLQDQSRVPCGFGRQRAYDKVRCPLRASFPGFVWLPSDYNNNLTCN